MLELSARDARRIALAAQGLGKRPARPPSRDKLAAAIEALGLLQIDSVNVVSRAHYLPLYSRLGAYDRTVLEDLAWGKRRRLFEYWAHEASLLPLPHQPLLRWRMQDAAAGIGMWKGVAAFLRERSDVVEHALGHIRDRGPLAASDIDIGDKGTGGWWGWSDAKQAMECLFWTGQVTAVARRKSFERVYATPDMVLPRDVLDAPTPSRRDAQRELVNIAARAMGIATARELRDYYRLSPQDATPRINDLVDSGNLIPVRVEGWTEKAYLARDAAPRPTRAHALLSPFDNAIWFRDRAERLFGVRVVLEIYTPEAKRVFGYYVLPFLEGDAITARVDLKADRKTSCLIVKAAHAEPKATAHTAGHLAAELRLFAGWLGLETIRVEDRGQLAPHLRDILT